MKIVLIGIILLQTITMFYIWDMNEKKILNMSNTVSPIIQQISEKLGEYKNLQMTIPAKGGQLISKREPSQSCISGMGNFYYIRVFEWAWKMENFGLNQYRMSR